MNASFANVTTANNKAYVFMQKLAFSLILNQAVAA